MLPSLIVLWAFGGSLSAISVGTQAFAGRRFAQRRYDDAGAVLFNAASMAFVAGIAFTALSFVCLEPIIHAMTSSATK